MLLLKRSELRTDIVPGWPQLLLNLCIKELFKNLSLNSNGCALNLNEYGRARNLVTSLIRKTEKQYFDHVSSNTTTILKKLWQKVHKATSNSKFINSMHPDLNCTDMNDFFTGIGKKIADSFKKTPLVWNNPKCIHNVIFNPVPEESNLKSLSPEFS